MQFGGSRMFNRILVAIDGSAMSKKALNSAIQFAKERYSKIGVIHVEKNFRFLREWQTNRLMTFIQP